MPIHSPQVALRFFASFPVALAVTMLWPLALLAALAGAQRLERFIRR